MTYFSRAQAQVSSALVVLTSEFEMGSGVTLPLEPPEQWCFFIEYIKNSLMPRLQRGFLPLGKNNIRMCRIRSGGSPKGR